MTTMTKVDIRIKGKTYGVRLPVHVWEAFEAHAKSLDWSIAQLAEAARKESNGTLTEAIEAYVARWLTTYKHTTRETWLMALVDLMRPEFAKRGYELPAKIRASIAFTSTGWRGKTRGECWRAEMSADQTTEIMVCLRESDPVRILNILTHELCHAAQFLKAAKEGRTIKGKGHGKDFRAIADALDLTEGKTPQALGDPKGAWGEWAVEMLGKVGNMPHSALAEFVAKEKKQTTRMLKLEHEGCQGEAGSTVWRMSAKHILGLETLSCPCCGKRVPNPHFEGGEDGEDGEVPEEYQDGKRDPLDDLKPAARERTPKKTVNQVDRTLKAIGNAVRDRVDAAQRAGGREGAENRLRGYRR